MSRARCVQAGAVILLVATLSGCTPDNDDAGDVGVRPNLLVIVADDLGINDVGVYGNATVETPHIDRLAADGMRFTRFYTAGDVCAPTRASLTTGLYPQRLGYRRAVRGISSEVVTLPELLRLSGYATHHIGKWHLGDSPREARPRAQGYDTFFGFLDQLFLKPPRPNGSPGQPTYHDPLLMEDDSDPVAHAGHLTDLLTAAAVERIQATSDGSPWLLTLWYYAPHAPSQPPLRWASRYPNTPEGRYYALVRALDEGIGRVVAALESSGQAQRTVVVFLSDNGGTGIAAPSNAPYLGRKTQFYEGALRVPLIIRRPQRGGGAVIDTVVSSLDVYPTLAALAHVDLDHEIDGRDLTPLLEGDPAGVDPSPLFWEYHAWAGPWANRVRPTPRELASADLQRGFDFSVLTADGRWRLSKEQEDIALFDLSADPTGYTNVHAEYPQIVADLLAQYRSWSREMREIHVRADIQGSVTWRDRSAELSGGRVDLVGHDLIRTPGVGGWSFAVGVQPAHTPADTQVIARQPHAWSLERDRDGRLIASMGGTSLVADGPAPRDCAAVVFTADFLTASSLGPDAGPSRKLSRLRLYVDGELVAEGRPEEWISQDALRRVTYLGNDRGLKAAFVGVLHEPTLLNAQLDTGDVGDLSATLCE